MGNMYQYLGRLDVVHDEFENNAELIPHTPWHNLRSGYIEHQSFGYDTSHLSLKERRKSDRLGGFFLHSMMNTIYNKTT